MQPHTDRVGVRVGDCVVVPVAVDVLDADDVCEEEEEEEDVELLVLVPVLVLDPELVPVDVDVPVGQG
jgi:hypothetical protein